MHQKRKLTNIVPYFHVYLIGLTNGYADIKDKLLANITNKSYCKQFFFCFEVVQTIYFGVSSSANNFFFQISHPPLQKNNGSSLKWNVRVLSPECPGLWIRVAQFFCSGRPKRGNWESCGGKNVRARLGTFHLFYLFISQIFIQEV